MLFVLFFVFSCAQSEPLVPVSFTEKCSVWDSLCLTNNIQRIVPQWILGMPEMGLSRLDPLEIPFLHLNRDGLVFDMYNIEMCGASQLIVNKASLDKFSKQFRLKFTIPSLVINSTYVGSGHIIDMPLIGKGDMYLRYDGVEYDIIYNYDEREDKKGRKFAELKNEYVSFDITGGVIPLLTNLSPENKNHSVAVHKYLQDNWKPINAIYGRIFLEAFNENFFDSLRKTLHITPLNNLYFDY